MTTIITVIRLPSVLEKYLKLYSTYFSNYGSSVRFRLLVALSVPFTTDIIRIVVSFSKPQQWATVTGNKDLTYTQQHPGWFCQKAFRSYVA